MCKFNRHVIQVIIHLSLFMTAPTKEIMASLRKKNEKTRQDSGHRHWDFFLDKVKVGKAGDTWVQLIQRNMLSEMYGETLLKSVQHAKIAHLFFLRTERKVRIALCAIHNQSALDWTADEIIEKNNKYTVRKCFYLENKYSAEISAKFPCKVNGIFFQHAVQCNFSETAFTCFVNAKGDTRFLSRTNWRASEKYQASLTAVSL